MIDCMDEWAGETRIGVAGDWHGSIAWAQLALPALRRRDVGLVFHVGDFGIWPGRDGAAFLKAVEWWCARTNVQLVVTPGNHEDYDQINAALARADGKPAWLTEHIAVLPRGYRWTVAGRSFVSLGGGPSVDYEDRIEGIDWWPAEAITDEDVERVLAGGSAEVMLTHDAPDGSTNAVGRIVDTNPLRWSAGALAYAAEGRSRLTQAVQGVQPSLLVHGHYHLKADQTVAHGDSWSCRYVSLANEHRSGNLAVIDPTGGEVFIAWIDV